MNELTLFEGLLFSGILALLFVAVLIIISCLVEKIICRLSPSYNAHYEQMKADYKEKQKIRRSEQ